VVVPEWPNDEGKDDTEETNKNALLETYLGRVHESAPK